MSNRTLSSILFTLYNIGLFGAIFAIPALAFLVFSIPNPNATGRTLITVALVSAVVLVSLAVTTRIAMRAFYDRVCGAPSRSGRPIPAWARRWTARCWPSWPT
ncbi:MAG: hypothetical protein HZY76_00395 [Anaerolineae bacterium]|nr:MAG: hypothetical protein HZY76_00395 [Anaerolineae bacterium]